MSTRVQMESFTMRLKNLERVYASLDSPSVDFYTFLGLVGNPHFALLVDIRHEKDGKSHGSYPTDEAFLMGVGETHSCSKRNDIGDFIARYKEEEETYDKSLRYDHDCYLDCRAYEAYGDEPHPHPCVVVGSSRPFTGNEIEVTMTSGRKILCEDHPNMVYLDDFDSVYQKMKACPGIL